MRSLVLLAAVLTTSIVLAPETQAGIMPEGVRLWPDGRIPYEIRISESAYPEVVAAIHEAIARAQVGTAVRFAPRTSEDVDYLSFVLDDFAADSDPTNDGNLLSDIGRTGGGQRTMMGSYGGTFSSLILHELGHVMGFDHEQKRDDRPQYVAVNWESIEVGEEDNFYLDLRATKVHRYNAQSPMHYGPCAYHALPCDPNHPIASNSTLLRLPSLTTDLGGDFFNAWNRVEINSIYAPTASMTHALGPGLLYRIQAQHSGLCLTVPGSGDGVALIQSGCNGGSDQLFHVIDAGEGRFSLAVASSDRCLDVEGGAEHDGARVAMWRCYGGPNQRWWIILGATGFEIVHAGSGKCLDVSGYSGSPGAPVFQYECWGGSNQTWNFSPVAPVSRPPGLPPRQLSVDEIQELGRRRAEPMRPSPGGAS